MCKELFSLWEDLTSRSAIGYCFGVIAAHFHQVYFKSTLKVAQFSGIMLIAAAEVPETLHDAHTLKMNDCRLPFTLVKLLVRVHGYTWITMYTNNGVEYDTGCLKKAERERERKQL